MIRYRHSLLIILLFFIGFGFFGFADIAQGAQSGKGWYKNILTDDSTCQQGEWELQIDIFDTKEAIISADTIQIRANLWQDTTGDGEFDYSFPLYNNSFLSSSTIKVCIPAQGTTTDMMVLTVSVSKEGYKTIWSYQKGRPSGNLLEGHKWIRKIYLAKNEESINLAHGFPTGNYIVTSTEEASLEIDISLRPGSESISEIILYIIDETSEKVFKEVFIPTQEMIDQGKIIFPLEGYPDAKYRWHVRLMEDNEGYLYPNLEYDQFTVDTTPPTAILDRWIVVSRTQMQFQGSAQDELSGLRKIEIYFDGKVVRTCNYNGTILLRTCNTQVVFDPSPLENGTYFYKIVAEDMGGLKSEDEDYFIIAGETAILNVKSVVITDREEYKDMQIKIKHTGGQFAGNEYETPYEIVVDGEHLEVEIEWPKRAGEDGPLCYAITGVYFSLSGDTCASCAGDVCRSTIRVWKGEFGQVRFRYSDQINIYGNLYGTTKKIEGSMGDFEEGYGEIKLTVSTPIDAVLEAPEKTTHPTLGEMIFRFWSGCDEVFGPDNRYCRIIEDPYTHRVLWINFGRLANSFEAYSYVNGAEVEGAVIERTFGDLGAGGITRYIFAYPPNMGGTIILKAPEYHGGESFTNWSGECSQHSTLDRTCTVELFYDSSGSPAFKKIAANYGIGSINPTEEYSLSVLKSGSGQGKILSDPIGINCGINCKENFPIGLLVELSANPEANSSFAGWSGAGTEECSGSVCRISMTADRIITASFTFSDSDSDPEGSIINNLYVESLPNGVQIFSSSPGFSGTTNYDIATTSDISAWLVAPATITSGGESYIFNSWSNCTEEDASNSRNCKVELTGGGDLTITANYGSILPPSAKISCEVIYCGGLGCICNDNPFSNWETFFGNVLFNINNASTENINESIWEIWDDEGFLENEKSCDSKCDWGTFQSSVGSYRIELTVKNEAGSSIDSRQIKVKKDIIAGFECSLDEENWYSDCKSSNVLKDQIIYLRDTSTPSEGANINFREWKLNDDILLGDGTTTSINIIESGQNTISLYVRDTNGRSDSETKNINARLPLPQWKEVRPF